MTDDVFSLSELLVARGHALCSQHYISTGFGLSLHEFHACLRDTPGCDDPLPLACALIATRSVHWRRGKRTWALGDTFDPVDADEQAATVERLGYATDDAVAFEQLCRESPITPDAAPVLVSTTGVRPAWFERVVMTLVGMSEAIPASEIHRAMRFACSNDDVVVAPAEAFAALVATGVLRTTPDGSWVVDIDDAVIA